ncbi:MAG: hypothetical protein JXP73_04340 [Deltaproteobacteria bacterium]|nr:hypothetical protein [Deltaproteobacteria bacterium]
MHRQTPLGLLCAASLALATLAACGGISDGPSPDGAGGGETAASAPLGNDGIDAGGAGKVAGIAVVNSDYASSSVSLLDRDGNLVADGCLHSGSGDPGLSATLSGDVVLPTEVPAGGPIPVIDRANNAITWLDATTCAVLGQLAVGTGFRANPQDVVTLSASKAYVVRQDPNPVPTPALEDFDDGNDVLIVDPSRLQVTGRIDLGPYAPAGVLPRGHRALLAGGSVFVSLNAIGADYAAYGAGRVVVIDPATDVVTGVIDIPGAKNCGALAYAAAVQRLFVACGGAYGEPAGQAATSAIVAIDLGQVPPAVAAQAAATGGAPYSNLTVGVLDATTAVAVVVGDFSNDPPDSLWSVPLDGRAPVQIFASTEGFAIGALLFDPERALVFAADGPMGSSAYLRIFEVSAAGFVLGKTAKTNPTHKLPPRALAFH